MLNKDVDGTAVPCNFKIVGTQMSYDRREARERWQALYKPRDDYSDYMDQVDDMYDAGMIDAEQRGNMKAQYAMHHAAQEQAVLPKRGRGEEGDEETKGDEPGSEAQDMDL